LVCSRFLWQLAHTHSRLLSLLAFLNELKLWNGVMWLTSRPLPNLITLSSLEIPQLTHLYLSLFNASLLCLFHPGPLALILLINDLPPCHRGCFSTVKARLIFSFLFALFDIHCI